MQPGQKIVPMCLTHLHCAAASCTSVHCTTSIPSKAWWLTRLPNTGMIGPKTTLQIHVPMTSKMYSDGTSRHQTMAYQQAAVPCNGEVRSQDFIHWHPRPVYSVCLYRSSGQPVTITIAQLTIGVYTGAHGLWSESCTVLASYLGSLGKQGRQLMSSQLRNGRQAGLHAIGGPGWRAGRLEWPALASGWARPGSCSSTCCQPQMSA